MPTLKPHKELLLDLILDKNHTSMPYAELIVGDPRINEDTALAGDTAVTISYYNPKKYYGNVVATFYKLDLTELFATIGVTALHCTAAGSTVHDLISALQTTYNWTVYAEDLLDDTVQYVDGEAEVTLRAAPGSLFYKGEISLEVTRPQEIPLSDLIKVKTLSGLNYPQEGDARHLSEGIRVTSMSGFTPA